MNTLNIHMKIEAKAMLAPITPQRFMETTNLTLNQLYKAFSQDVFQLPYQVNKLSKKARRAS